MCVRVLRLFLKTGLWLAPMMGNLQMSITPGTLFGTQASALRCRNPYIDTHT